MLNRFKPKSEFSINVLTLMTGTTIAQAIPIAISPILTRLYTPEDFGVFALYMSVVSIVAVISTGRYEMAIMLPEKDESAINLTILSIMISSLVSLMVLVIVFFFDNQIVNILGNPNISTWIYFVPFSIFLTGIYQSLNYWVNRKKGYKTLSVNRTIQSATTATVNLGAGFMRHGSGGLIFGTILGQIMAIVTLARSQIVCKSVQHNVARKAKIMSLAKEYIKFPKFDIFASFLNIFSDQAIHIFLNIVFNATTAGFYYLTQRVLSLPISFISSAVSDVFREQASVDYRKTGNASFVYKDTLKKLFFIGIVPFMLLYFFAVDAFQLIFGKEWSVAGEYAKILLPMFFLRFISSPLSFMLYIAQRQKLNMYSQMAFVVFAVMAFIIGEDPYEVICCISLFYSMIYLYYLYISAKIAKVF